MLLLWTEILLLLCNAKTNTMAGGGKRGNIVSKLLMIQIVLLLNKCRSNCSLEKNSSFESFIFPFFHHLVWVSVIFDRKICGLTHTSHIGSYRFQFNWILFEQWYCIMQEKKEDQSENEYSVCCVKCFDKNWSWAIGSRSFRVIKVVKNTWTNLWSIHKRWQCEWILWT